MVWAETLTSQFIKVFMGVKRRKHRNLRTPSALHNFKVVIQLYNSVWTTTVIELNAGRLAKVWTAEYTESVKAICPIPKCKWIGNVENTLNYISKTKIDIFPRNLLCAP